MAALKFHLFFMRRVLTNKKHQRIIFIPRKEKRRVDHYRPIYRSYMVGRRKICNVNATKFRLGANEKVSPSKNEKKLGPNFGPKIRAQKKGPGFFMCGF